MISFSERTNDSPDTGEVADDLDAKFIEQLGITNARTLENLGTTKGTRADDDHLACLDLYRALDELRR